MSQKVYTFCDKDKVIDMTQSIDNKVVSRIYGKKRGWVFTPHHFLNLGSRTAVAKALERLAESGTIRRLARGLYDYPEKHPVLGELPANYERIAQALAGRDSLKIQPSGAYAANLLGLTEQVPARIVFLTDGANKTVQVKNQQIVLKRTTPKNMATAGRVSGLVIQALRYLGKDYVNDKIIGILKKRLTEDDKRRLMRDFRYAPAWIGVILKRVSEHKSLFFKANWAHYDEAKPGTLRLVPRDNQVSQLKNDYRQMQQMFFEEPPSFERIMEKLRIIEDKINGISNS